VFDGVTALQMDIKIQGITREIMEKALEQAKGGRIWILGEMAKVLGEARDDLSEHAPRFITIKINPEKIAAVIGKGGVSLALRYQERELFAPFFVGAIRFVGVIF